ncbi:MAG TPA: hypothetical protein VHP38_13650, partial [Ruminiclostridium sp.]|nr:hypothetical protein [Ruminiclostridium sp.]
DIFELISYLREIESYIEFSFYKNSSEIMGAISKKGIDAVLSIISMREIKKGVYECVTTWEVDKDKWYSKNVTIDISSEMVYITESLESDNTNSVKNAALLDIDLQKEYGEILDLLKTKHLNSIEKDILTKVVAAFFN